MEWQAGDESNAHSQFWRLLSFLWTTGPGWLGAVDLNHVRQNQTLKSYQLDERRMDGTAGAIRTPDLDRRRVRPLIL